VKSDGKLALVTGAAGFVGSHLVERLVQAGYRVRCFLRYTSTDQRGFLSELSSSNKIEIVAGDLRDAEAVRQAVQGTDVIFHLGALVGIPYSYVHPFEVVETNIMGTVNVLLAARDASVGRILFASTSEVYGTARYTPIDEKHPLQGQSPYSASKIGAEKTAESFHASFGLPTTVIRPFNIYGPRQSARAVIPTIITQALASDAIRLGNLQATRDFTYVEDTVAAFLLAAESDAAVGKTFNIGSNFEVSIRDVAEMVIRLVGRKVPLIEDAARVRPNASEVQRLWGDSSLAYQTIGWKPSVSLEEGLGRTIRWISQNLDRYRVGEYAV
jgi:NAD dependent epimerase/dehydratase